VRIIIEEMEVDPVDSSRRSGWQVVMPPDERSSSSFRLFLVKMHDSLSVCRM
jgi:hypothetical protein